MTESKIGNKIKELLEKTKHTPLELAGSLGLSAHEAERWIAGTSLPPPEALPRIARWFGIATDELLGVNAEEEAKAFEALCAEISALIDTRDYGMAVERALDAYSRYPNNDRVKLLLMNALYLRCDSPKTVRQNSERIFALGESIIAGCKDESIRADAFGILALHCACNLEDRERAVGYVEMLPAMAASREEVTRRIYADRKGACTPEGLKHLRANIAAYAEYLTGSIALLAADDTSLPLSERIELYETAIKIENTVCGREPQARAAEQMRRHISLCELNILAGDKPAACRNLSDAADYAIFCDAQPQRSLRRTGMLSGTESVKHAGDERLVEWMTVNVINRRSLDPIRYESAFADICAKLGRARAASETPKA